MTPSADVMNLFTIANEGKYRLTSVERIAFDANGKEKSKESASQTQLDKLTEKFFADDGKLNSLVGYLNNRGGLDYEFTTEAGKKITGTIPK